MKSVLWAVLAAVFLGSSYGRAEGLDPKKVTLQCWINRSESLFLVQDEETVYYSMFPKTPVAMTMDKFTVLRCPYCYSFSGSVDGREFVGSTGGHMDSNSKTWNVTLTLSIDGSQQHEIPCAPPTK